MATHTADGRAGTFSGSVGRGAVVLAVVAVQALALVAANALGRPTLYAVFALGSAAALAGVSAGVVGLVAAAAATAVLWGVAVLVGDVWVLLAGPVLVTVVAGRVSGRWTRAAAATLGTLLLLALAFPLGLFVLRQQPDLVAEKLVSPDVHAMLYLSMYAPFLAAVVSVALGVPLAYLLARGFPGQAVVESLVDLPLVVPHSVAGLLILFGFGRGAAFPDLKVLGTMLGIVLALTFVSAPFAVNGAREAFETVNRRVEFAARAHGANEFETVRRVSLPLAARGILTGGVMAWARGVSEFGAVAVVAYTVQFFYPLAFEQVFGQHAPVYIFNTYTSQGLEASGAVAAILLGLSALIFLVIRWLAYDEGGIL
jgi:molybdate/tungstate transport system permease protein